MKSRWFRCFPALVLLAALVLPPRGAAAAETELIQFTDRHGNTFYAPEEAFAVKVISFTPGDPWTSYEENQNPEDALGTPNAENDLYAVTLGGGGVLVLEMGIPVRDGPGFDLYVFEDGRGSSEAMTVAVSDDLDTWHDLGTLSGSTMEADLAGKTPAGMTFRYVRITDSDTSSSGTWPGVDIDAVCGSVKLYQFTDRDGAVHTAPVNAFATRVVDFLPGSPWTSYANSQKVVNALGMPDADGNDGDLTLGCGGSVTLAFDVEIYDGPGQDLFVFEVPLDIERTLIEVSADLKTWHEVGISDGGPAGVDIAGSVPEDYSFSYVRLTDLDHITSATSGADIDAVCGLNTREKSGSVYPYRINSIVVRNDTYRIAQEEMTVEVSVTKTGPAEEALVFLAAYSETGRSEIISVQEAESRRAGETFEVVFPVDNRSGGVKTLKAFVAGPYASLRPLSYGFVYRDTE